MLCSVPVPLQPSLHASGGEGAAGPGGVSEEHEEPHGNVQIHPIQTTQEGEKPEEGKKHFQSLFIQLGSVEQRFTSGYVLCLTPAEN